MKAIVNAKIIADDGLLEDMAVIFADKIRAVVPQSELDKYSIEEFIDAKKSFLAAGFIDIHIHGCSGSDTMDAEGNALSIMRSKLPSTGVTAFLPTTMTMEFAKIKAALARIRIAGKIEEGAQILGCNVEGPFINPKNKGAHDEKFISAFDYAKIEPYLDVIRLITIAPELTGSETFIKKCQAQNIVVSLGHSSAAYEEAMSAIKCGASHVTHIFNALPPLNHRQPGLIGAAMDSEVTCELIADNVHVHPVMQRILLKVKGLDKIILITDAMRAGLLGEGQYDLGGQTVFVNKNEARLSNGVIAGSVLTLNKAVYNFMNNAKLPVYKAVQLVTSNPARLLGLEQRKGSITVGKDADLTIFDKDINVRATFVGGKLEYWRQ
ncbi:MAG: N-acetylglucosamine-6-phosphate deacetylase [Pelosinus sp.]|nr:N-acetylglucosamine-6-phosphate deacetylase [Pelosinus sp.]